MSDERTTLSDEEIVTAPGDTRLRQQGDSDTADDTDTTDADTDDTDADADDTDAG
jgi:hypothetical protein